MINSMSIKLEEQVNMKRMNPKSGEAPSDIIIYFLNV